MAPPANPFPEVTFLVPEITFLVSLSHNRNLVVDVPLVGWVCPAARAASTHEPSRRYVPERPPVFSQRVTSLMVIERSSALHMS